MLLVKPWDCWLQQHLYMFSISINSKQRPNEQQIPHMSEMSKVDIKSLLKYFMNILHVSFYSYTWYEECFWWPPSFQSPWKRSVYILLPYIASDSTFMWMVTHEFLFRIQTKNLVRWSTIISQSAWNDCCRRRVHIYIFPYYV